jgi:hypothetical protein
VPTIDALPFLSDFQDQKNKPASAPDSAQGGTSVSEFWRKGDGFIFLNSSDFPASDILPDCHLFLYKAMIVID